MNIDKFNISQNDADTQQQYGEGLEALMQTKQTAFQKNSKVDDVLHLSDKMKDIISMKLRSVAASREKMDQFSWSSSKQEETSPKRNRQLPASSGGLDLQKPSAIGVTSSKFSAVSTPVSIQRLRPSKIGDMCQVNFLKVFTMIKVVGDAILLLLETFCMSFRLMKEHKSDKAVIVAYSCMFILITLVDGAASLVLIKKLRNFYTQRRYDFDQGTSIRHFQLIKWLFVNCLVFEMFLTLIFVLNYRVFSEMYSYLQGQVLAVLLYNCLHLFVGLLHILSTVIFSRYLTRKTISIIGRDAILQDSTLKLDDVVYRQMVQQIESKNRKAIADQSKEDQENSTQDDVFVVETEQDMDIPLGEETRSKGSKKRRSKKKQPTKYDFAISGISLLQGVDDLKINKSVEKSFTGSHQSSEQFPFYKKAYKKYGKKEKRNLQICKEQPTSENLAKKNNNLNFLHYIGSQHHQINNQIEQEPDRLLGTYPHFKATQDQTNNKMSETFGQIDANQGINNDVASTMVNTRSTGQENALNYPRQDFQSFSPISEKQPTYRSMTPQQITEMQRYKAGVDGDDQFQNSYSQNNLLQEFNKQQQYAYDFHWENQSAVYNQEITKCHPQSFNFEPQHFKCVDPESTAAKQASPTYDDYGGQMITQQNARNFPLGAKNNNYYDQQS